MRCLVIVSLLLIFATPEVFPQVVITKSDVEANLIGSQSITYGRDFSPSAVLNLGTASGSAQTFDFSSVTAQDTTRDTSIQDFIIPAGQFLADSFPTASLAIAGRDTSNPSVPISIVQYWSVENDGVYMLGEALSAPGIADSVIARYRPKAVVFPLPLTDTSRRSETDTLDITVGGTVLTRTITYRADTADGFGTLTIPGQASQPAIRAVTDEAVTSFSLGTFNNYSRKRHVVIIAKNMSLAQFLVTDTAYTGGNTAVERFEYAVRTGPATTVQQAGNAVPTQFALSQNYPNPFNPSTRIEVKVPFREVVTLKVFNVLGTEVATLMNQTLDPGIYKIAWNAVQQPSGVYYYRIQAGGFSSVKKMLLVK